MADPDAVAAFLALASSHGGGTLVRDHPKMDLDLYIQNYVGRTRFDRLLFVGKTCLPLCVDALNAAILEAKKGSDVGRYKEAWDCLRQAAPNEPAAQRDDAWIDRTEAANKAETSRLEAELKGYKNNLIKESIRMGNEDLGKHFESIGKLQDAQDSYSRMRQDVGTTKHIFDCARHLANVSLQRGDWATALSTIGKANSTQNNDNEKSMLSYVKIVSGIAFLGLGFFSEAADNFLSADFQMPPSEYAHIASPNDIAIYGGLTALASMERHALQHRVIGNSSFRIFLEQEPHIRKAIGLFINGRYSNCLAVLESARPDFMLDIHLHKHVSAIYSKIRCKCIVQYFAPFSCVTIQSLDAAFVPEGESVEPELVKMIRSGSLKARIDSKDQLLVAVRPDPRDKMQVEALNVARTYEKEAKERLRRISLVAASLEIIGANKKHTVGHASVLNTDEAWHNEGRRFVQAGGSSRDNHG